MSAKYRDEGEFGSDSFLDVLANLVGILIILIVAVGVRIAKTPPEDLLKTAAAAAVESPDVSPIPLPPAEPRELPPIPEYPPLQEIRPTEEMRQQALSLKQHYDSLQAQLAAMASEEARLEKLKQEQELALAALKQQVDEKMETTNSNDQQIATLEADLQKLELQVLLLQKQADEIKLDEAPVEQLTHHLPPIGRVVSGDEVHFRLHGDRVTFVPMSELAREVQFEIERRKEILLNRSFFQGTTRAVDGYMMEYVLQRQARNLNDDIRYGNGMIRIMVSSWIIKPVGPHNAETIDQAMQPGSHFQTALGRYGPTATVTFWVYPDSFEIHQKLKEFTHRAGYWVASRPLPTGVPIAGSPQGSRSVAQ